MTRDGVQLVAKNRKALFDYEVLDTVEVGLVLKGTEVKSLRDGKLQFRDAYASVHDGEMWLHHAHIAEYTHGNVFNHDPSRTRKLLAHRHEIDRLEAKVNEKGVTLIPLEVYFRRGKAKVKLGLCRGKAKQDKRQSIKERDERRAQARALED
ncbi:MAG TPA: SsrA-binding protein SmpB [Myxococcales bacterium LLY-WYZ-16_1]|nr:SsrA-binding protein SmpB [Myxococcales bacterium LLY-WYZ-16_1]